AVGSDESHAHAAGNVEMNVVEKFAAGDGVGKMFDADQLLRFAIGGGEIDAGGRDLPARTHTRKFADQFVGGVNARFGFGGAGLGAAAQPINLRMHTVFQSFLPRLLRVEISFFGFEEG